MLFTEGKQLVPAGVVLEPCIEDLAVEEPERVDHVGYHHHLRIVLLRRFELLQRQSRQLDKPVNYFGGAHLLASF